MCKSRLVFRALGRLVLSAALLSAGSAVANPNNWTNSADGLWRFSTNWSLAAVPNNTSNLDPTQITNAGTKTITIDSATPAGNLSLRGLTLSAPVGSTNSLALVNVPLGTPLTTSKALLVGNRSSLRITNSAVSATADFDVVNGSVILDSGSLNCALNCDVQNGSLLVNSGTLNATIGTTGIRMGRLNGASTSLTLNGGTVTTLRVTLGSVAGTQNTLSLAGGNLICNDSLSLAQQPSTTGNATLTSGNLIVTNGTTKIADRAAASFTQSGGSSAFADLSIGDLGVATFNLSGGQMTVTPRTTNDLCIVGNLENGTLNQSGGVIVLGGEIHVADFIGVTGAINLTGGMFFATNDLVAIGRYGSGSMTVSNATAVLTNTSVGRHDTGVGTLTVENNGNVFMIADLSIGRLASSIGQVVVHGGFLSLTNDDLWVGRDGTGDLLVDGGLVRAKGLLVGASSDLTNTPTGSFTLAGGTVLVSSNLVVGTSLFSTGQVAMVGGLLAVTNAAATAHLTVAQGTFNLNNGVLNADRIVLNTNTGTFNFNGGLLRARTLTVDNGAPFVVGDGVNPATLELGGGDFNFPQGLVISPNATVTGCGSIVGPVTNNGTLALNCPPTLAITAAAKSGNSCTVFFSSLAGSNHILEYKTNLASPSWISLLPAVVGNGNVMSKTDTAATNLMRFYRIRLQ